MRRAFIPVVIILIAIAGCAEEKKKAKSKKEPPPPPTPRQIAQTIISETALESPLPQSGSKLPPGAKQAFIAQLRQHKIKNSGTPEGQEALKLVSRKVGERIHAAEQVRLWETTAMLVEAYELLNPGSTDFASIKRKAQIELKRPQVTIKGFVYDGTSQRTVAFLDVLLPLEKKKEEIKATPGDEFFQMRFIEVVGRDEGIILEYLETGERFTILTKRAKLAAESQKKRAASGSSSR